MKLTWYEHHRPSDQEVYHGGVGFSIAATDLRLPVALVLGGGACCC